MWTRRDTAKALLAGTALPFIPVPAMARSPEDWSQRLVDRLNRHLASGQQARFASPRFDVSRTKGRTRMTAIVGLDWAPGHMRRRFEGEGDNAVDAFQRLETNALTHFTQSCPGTVV